LPHRLRRMGSLAEEHSQCQQQSPEDAGTTVGAHRKNLRKAAQGKIATHLLM
jgi:hypothetical protein